MIKFQSGAYTFSFGNTLKYFLVGILLTLIHFGVSNLYFIWYLFEVLIFTVGIYFTDYLCSKPTKADENPLLLNSLTCKCNSCKSWREERKLKTNLFPLLAISAIFIIWVCMLNMLYRGMDKGVYPKKSIAEAEFKVKFGKLETSLRTRLENEYYEINKVGDEIIENQQGDYYIVDIKMSNKSETLFFDKGEYVINNFDKKFYTPLNKFIDDVYSYLDAGAECSLYIKGSADILSNSTLNQNLKNGYDDTTYRSIEYLPRLPSDKYLKIAKLHSISGNYSNADLPFLRSAFLRNRITTTFKGIKIPEILEGFVESKVSDKDRNVTIILFVNFNKKKFLG